MAGSSPSSSARTARSRVSRVLTSAVAGAVAAGALAGAFVAGTSVGGEPPPSGPAPRPTGPPSLAAAGTSVEVADSCEELLDWYVERALDLVGPWGWEQTHVEGPVLLDRAGPEMALSAGASQSSAYKAPATQRSTSSGTGTNVQEAGVDEPDVVKTDGELLVRLRHDELTTYDVGVGADGALDPMATLELDDVRGGELLLSGDTVVVVAEQGAPAPHLHRPVTTAEAATTTVLTVDVSDPGAPRLTSTSEYDGVLLGARLHGDTVRLALASGLPLLDFVHPRRSRGPRESEQRNEELVRATTIEDWLPGFTAGGEDGRLLDCEAVSLPEEDSDLGTVAVVGFEAGSPAERSVQGLAAAADIAYFSADHLYLAASHGDRWEDGWWGGAVEVPDELSGLTTLHDLALTGTGTTYVATGQVEGSVADRWALDEHDGVLRVALGPSTRTANHNAVLTLERDGADLAEAGRVDRLGVDERIESVRWFEGLAIVVTFRQVDPLYAVDLTDPERPRLLGHLKIPGFSEYLHPLGPRRLVGVGQGPQAHRSGRADRPRRGFVPWGAQVGLFDVTDLTAPRRIDVLGYGPGTSAGAATDPRQLTWLPRQRTVLTVVGKGWGSGTTWVSVLRVDGGALHNRMVEVEHGSDGRFVRTVPLPDGRVVLVTGDEVSFFDV